jgi:hypothetical protein
MTIQNVGERSEPARVDDLEPAQALQLNRSPIIGLAFDPDERPVTPGALVETVGNLFALVLDNQQVARSRLFSTH